MVKEGVTGVSQSGGRAGEVGRDTDSSAVSSTDSRLKAPD